MSPSGSNGFPEVSPRISLQGKRRDASFEKAMKMVVKGPGIVSAKGDGSEKQHQQHQQQSTGTILEGLHMVSNMNVEPVKKRISHSEWDSDMTSIQSFESELTKKTENCHLEVKKGSATASTCSSLASSDKDRIAREVASERSKTTRTPTTTSRKRLDNTSNHISSSNSSNSTSKQQPLQPLKSSLSLPGGESKKGGSRKMNKKQCSFNDLSKNIRAGTAPVLENGMDPKTMKTLGASMTTLGSTPIVINAKEARQMRRSAGNIGLVATADWDPFAVEGVISADGTQSDPFKALSSSSSKLLSSPSTEHRKSSKRNSVESDPQSSASSSSRRARSQSLSHHDRYQSKSRSSSRTAERSKSQEPRSTKRSQSVEPSTKETSTNHSKKHHKRESKSGKKGTSEESLHSLQSVKSEPSLDLSLATTVASSTESETGSDKMNGSTHNQSSLLVGGSISKKHGKQNKKSGKNGMKGGAISEGSLHSQRSIKSEHSVETHHTSRSAKSEPELRRDTKAHGSSSKNSLSQSLHNSHSKHSGKEQEGARRNSAGVVDGITAASLFNKKTSTDGNNATRQSRTLTGPRSQGRHGRSLSASKRSSSRTSQRSASTEPGTRSQGRHGRSLSASKRSSTGSRTSQRSASTEPNGGKRSKSLEPSNKNRNHNKSQQKQKRQSKNETHHKLQVDAKLGDSLPILDSKTLTGEDKRGEKKSKQRSNPSLSPVPSKKERRSPKMTGRKHQHKQKDPATVAGLSPKNTNKKINDGNHAADEEKQTISSSEGSTAEDGNVVAAGTVGVPVNVANGLSNVCHKGQLVVGKDGKTRLVIEVFDLSSPNGQSSKTSSTEPLTTASSHRLSFPSTSQSKTNTGTIHRASLQPNSTTGSSKHTATVLFGTPPPLTTN